MHSDAMSAQVRKARDSRLIVVGAANRQRSTSGRFVRLAHLRKLCECEQAAAICYRVRGGAIEFLLIRTRGGGRWTFPKGSAEPGLTHAQAAALEAFEEAGVHGRIEEASFAQYRRKLEGGESRASGSGEKGVAVNAYLCEVLRLSPPQESKRDRTWFSIEEARRRLREGRKHNGAAEFVRVVDKAVARIQQLRGRIGTVHDHPRGDQQNDGREDRQQAGAQLKDPQPKDALQKVRFDFTEAYGRAEGTSFMPQIRRQLNGTRQSSMPIIDVHSREVLPCEVLEFGQAREKKSKALGTGVKTG
jgi:8-oxo-dGTP pyrophosphatase MutT (NUDIX family)